MVDLVYGALLVGAALLGWKLWVFLSREDAKHRADVEQKLQVARTGRAEQRLDELYRRFRNEMQANPAHVPFVALLDAVRHGTISDVEHAYAAHAELPLLVAHQLQQLHEAKADCLDKAIDADEAKR